MTEEPIAIYYHRAAYSETIPANSATKIMDGMPRGIMGREVASHEFLRALLRYSKADRIDVLLSSDADREPFCRFCADASKDLPTVRHVKIIPPSDQAGWLKDPTATILHFAYPPEPSFARARAQASVEKFAMSGVTHTLCTQRAMQTLGEYRDTPWQAFDRLVATSMAVESLARKASSAIATHFAADRPNGIRNSITIETIPLGVDTKLHKPATRKLRHDSRRRLGILDHEAVLLFTGRLSHHSKAHPFAMFEGAQRVAKKLGQDIHLLLCGWFSNPSVRAAYLDTAQRIAPNIRVTIVDGMDSWWRFHAWDCADIFVSLADSIQETFGLTPLEAMSRGIPVIASDWNGYRDIVVHGKTGYLVPTAIVKGAHRLLHEQLATGEVDYDLFLAKSNQMVTVSIESYADKLIQLLCNPQLQREFAEEATARAKQLFDWSQIIPRYEAMWRQQREELRLHQTQASSPKAASTEKELSKHIHQFEPYYPPIDTVFEAYPTCWLDSDSKLSKSDNAVQLTRDLLADRLCNYCLPWLEQRDSVLKVIAQINSVATVAEWVQTLAQQDVADAWQLNVIAWLCKYDVLKAATLANCLDVSSGSAVSLSEPLISFVITCKGRLDQLKQTLPSTVSQPDSNVIVVDYSCPQSAGDWVQKNFPTVKVVRVTGKSTFNRSDAKNHGAFAASSPWICLLDADIVLSPDFTSEIRRYLVPNGIVRCGTIGEGTGGTLLCQRELFLRANGHDIVYEGWGEEDDDLVDALKFVGGHNVFYPAQLIEHLEHEDDQRTAFHDEKSRPASHMVNRLYRAAKWDLARILGKVPALAQRQQLYQDVRQGFDRWQTTGESDLTIPIGTMFWKPIDLDCSRSLQYRLRSLSQGG